MMIPKTSLNHFQAHIVLEIWLLLLLPNTSLILQPFDQESMFNFKESNIL